MKIVNIVIEKFRLQSFLGCLFLHLVKKGLRKKCRQQDKVQLEEDGGSSTRQSWMETSGLCLSSISH